MSEKPCGRIMRRADGRETTCVLPDGHVMPIEHQDEEGWRMREEIAAQRDYEHGARALRRYIEAQS